MVGGRIPVILDTDIGSDIDDMWALAMLLRSPELDLKLVVTDSGDTVYRAKIAAKMLGLDGRADVPVGIGTYLGTHPHPQGFWVEDYDLASYPGVVHEDGVQAIIDIIMASPEPVTLIAIGPVPNISAALEREPRIVERARFVGMHGSLHLGYGGKQEMAAEYNVRAHPEACRKVFDARWDVTITPLDTCGLVALQGEAYRAVYTCADPLIQALIENYQQWIGQVNWVQGVDPQQQSTVLFDTVAVYLAFAEDLLVMEDLPVRVTDEGYTVIDNQAKMIRCATAWQDRAAFERLLVERLTGGE